VTDSLVLNELKLDERGLIPVIAQDRVTGEVRMLAWASLDAVKATLATGRATFFSRSRNELWEKGRASGNTLAVSSVLVDCDADALIYLVTPSGPTCHTGAPSCFFRSVATASSVAAVEGTTLLARLDEVLLARTQATASKSYAKSLFDAGPEKIGAKLREEAAELAEATANEADERVISEAADVLFHVMVAVRSRGLGIASVLHELERRTGISGHEEKAARKSH
jgi:phosphoribosyl-AMP cyclohydrolase / phosphoribosyl-ATP pyrophosphohydrolase